ncbi:hypothetical protein C8J57DRAFT_1334168 [Mycena rebaudengoi]|nr:hypothetical protein C8J57DRAFT_1334168 [Mycena rebaudengoi]
MLFSFAVASLFFGLSTAVVSVTPAGSDTVCAGQVTLSETYIGEHNNVKVSFATCPDVGSQSRALTSRQTVTNVCGTNCFVPSGGGPNPNDCHIIADALRFNSQNIGAIFQVNTGTNNTVVMQFASCLSFFVNQDLGPIAYCRTDWAALIDFIAPNCQATQNAHGGNCVATDQRWFAQVQHA